MAHDFKFFDRLYQGFEAEYLVASALFGAGLEAFKLPGDFGFDLLVSNQLQEARDRPSSNTIDEDRAPFPYALQVKSRRARTEDIRLVDRLDRRELEMTFALKPHEYDLLISSERAFLVCVLFLPPDQRSLSARPLVFWLKGGQLQAMREREYLLHGVDEYGQSRLTLHAVYRFVPVMRRETFADRLMGALSPLQAHMADNASSRKMFDEAMAACRAHIVDLLPEALESNRAGNEYIALRRREWDKTINDFSDELTTAKMLDARQADLTCIGSTSRIFPIDDSGIGHWLKVRKRRSTIDEAQSIGTQCEEVSSVSTR